MSDLFGTILSCGGILCCVSVPFLFVLGVGILFLWNRRDETEDSTPVRRIRGIPLPTDTEDEIRTEEGEPPVTHFDELAIPPPPRNTATPE